MKQPKIYILPHGDLILADLAISSATIKFIKPRSKRTHYRAIINWLTKYQPQPNASDIELLRGYLESLHHFCQLQLWKPIQFLLSIPININSSKITCAIPLSEYLFFKALSKNLLTVSEEILFSFQSIEGELNSILMLKARALSDIGGKTEESFNLFRTILQKSSDHSEYHVEAKARLGMTQISYGFYKEGLVNLEQALDLINSQETFKNNIKMQELTADILNGMALYEMNSYHLQKAFDLYQIVVDIRQELKLEYRLIDPLVNQGVLMRRMGKYQQGLGILAKARVKAELLGNEKYPKLIDHHVANIYIDQGKYDLAENLSVKALEVFKKLERPRGVADCHEQLGRIKLARGEINEAEKSFKISLSIRESVGNFHGATSSLKNLAILSWHKHNSINFFYFGIKSWMRYYSMKILNFVRIYRMIQSSYVWIFGKKVQHNSLNPNNFNCEEKKHETAKN